MVPENVSSAHDLERTHWDAKFTERTWIFFGKESAGLPADLLAAYPNAVVRVPMVEGARGLNISTAAGIVLYEALRQLSAGASTV